MVFSSVAWRPPAVFAGRPALDEVANVPAQILWAGNRLCSKMPRRSTVTPAAIIFQSLVGGLLIGLAAQTVLFEQ